MVNLLIGDEIMASAVIHLCVAKKVNEKLKMNERELLLGSIAPDLSKQVGEEKKKSHFLKGEEEDSKVDIKAFLDLYKSELNKPFEMGYFIHLLTDKYWFLDYVYDFIDTYAEKELGKKVSYTELKDIIYNDYSNINTELIDRYNISLDIFYQELDYPKSIIKEIPINHLDLIVEKMGIIITNSTSNKPVIFDIDKIVDFIESVSTKILDIISKYNLYNY